MSEGVVYMLNGRRIWNVAAVSLMTLRDHYDGPVCLIVQDPPSEEFAAMVNADDRAGEILIIQRPTNMAKRNASHAQKPTISRQTPFESTIQIDADTAIYGDFRNMFPTANEQAVITAFGQWHTLGNIMRKRVSAWESVAAPEVAECLSKTYRAINTGVVGYHRNCEFTEAWIEMTARRPQFMCDELAVQLLIPAWSDQLRIMDDRFNWSPLYGSTPIDDVVIAHFHGKKHCHEKAAHIWVPLWQRAVRENWFGICDWGSRGEHDRRLKGYLDAKAT